MLGCGFSDGVMILQQAASREQIPWQAHVLMYDPASPLPNVAIHTPAKKN
jgi:hypothetical protein